MKLLSDFLKQSGRFPLVELRLTPLVNRSKQPRSISKTIVIDKFISYNFTSSMLVPVDNFSYSFSAPSDDKPFTDYIIEGDIVTIYANGTLLSTGIVDQIEIECDGDSGEKVTVNGRNLLGQLEDQSCISIDMTPIWLQKNTIIAGFKRIMEGTRLPKTIIDNGIPAQDILISTMPDESKMSAMLRILEPVNCLIWAAPDGSLIIGKPSFNKPVSGKMMISKSKRSSNVLSMRVVRSGSSIPSRYVSLWSDCEVKVQATIPDNQIFENTSDSAKRLLLNGHIVTKSMTSSISSGGENATNQLASANKAGTNVLSQMAFRQMARDNFNEVIVTCIVAGHYNEKNDPFLPDTVYNIEYDRASLNENMYLYSVEYQGSVDRGQWSILNFCKLNTIVEGSKINA